jgi:hypothetical protein
MVELLLWTVACWAIFSVACAYFHESLGSRWKPVAALTVVPAALIAAVLVFLAPPVGGYDPVAARYWMSRAAAEPDSAAKAAYVRRVALASAEHGWFVASQAIDSVGDPIQRCRLRTLLATLPEIRHKEKLGKEARDECNATIGRGSS